MTAPTPPAATATATVVVVGTGLAGIRAAETLRRNGFAGRITLVGAEKHWPPFDRPPLSKELLSGKWPQERGRLRTELDPVTDATPRGLDLVLGRRAIALDTTTRTITFDDDTAVSYDGLVVATGTSPLTLPGVQEIRGVHVLRTADDMASLKADLDGPAYVAVVGAGFIGCEVAATCREMGHPVSLVEALDKPLVNILGDDMGELVAELHRDHGVELHTGQLVTALEGQQRVDGVRLVDGTLVRADTVVIGIGVAPNTGWLEGSGLLIDNGIVCDATLAAVGVENVVVAGDVARWPHPLYDGELVRIEHWTNAAEQGEHAARTLLAQLEGGSDGNTPEPFATVPYFWTDQYDTRLQLLGRSTGADRIVVAEPPERTEDGRQRLVVAYLREDRVAGALCVNRPNRTIAWRNAVAERAAWPLSA